jgi:hypothetical protein
MESFLIEAEMPRPGTPTEPSVAKDRAPLSLRLNVVLLRAFVTIWSIAYYIVYFRNPAYLAFIAFALAVDFARLSPDISTGILHQFKSRKLAFASLISVLFAGQCWLVLFYHSPSIAFLGPYDHFRVAIRSTSAIYAAAIYILESAGAAGAWLIIVYFGIRSASVEDVAGLQETEAALKRVRPRKEISKLLWFFLALYALQIALVFATIRNGVPRPHEYHPQTNPIQLALFTATPVFFAYGMKTWLREVLVFANRARSEIDALKPR